MTNEEFTAQFEEFKKEIERKDFNYARRYLREKLNEIRKYYREYGKFYDNGSYIHYRLHRKFRAKASNTKEYISLVDTFVNEEKDKVYMRHIRELNRKEYDEYFFMDEKEYFDSFVSELIDDLYEDYRKESVIELMTSIYYDKKHTPRDRVYNENVRKKYNKIFERMKKNAILTATNYRTNSVADKNHCIIVTDGEVAEAKELLQCKIKLWIIKLMKHL